MESRVRLTLLVALLVGMLSASAPIEADYAPSNWPKDSVAKLPEVAVQQADELVVVKINHELVSDDPFAVGWWAAPYVEVELYPQQMARPILDESSVETLRIQGLTDGNYIAWRVSWHDPTPDGNVDVSRFSDGVAVEFPLDEDALPMMGDEESDVQILLWKALWQKDIDVGFQDVQDVHPNFWADLYWFAEGEFPYPVPTAFENPAAMQWFIAHEAGNPMAIFSRRQPVQELVARGWSTLTNQPYSVATSRGIWIRDSWAVVFRRPMATDDPLDYQFASGADGQIAFAVWDGSSGNVGGRKHWSDWVNFRIEE